MRRVEFPRVGIGVDDQARLVRVCIDDMGTGRHLARAFCQTLRDQPQVAAYDQVWDLLQFDGDATHEDIVRIQEVYLQVAKPGADLAYTCLVTRDDCMRFWAAAMDEQFPGRKHLVMHSVAQADDWLNQIRRRCAAAAMRPAA